MVKKLSLQAKSRKKEDNNSKFLLSKGLVPAVVYGPKTKNYLVSIKLTDLEKAYEKVGEANLLNLVVAGEKEKTANVLIKSLQKDPVKDTPIHVDFYEVDMHKAIEVEVPINFVGESPAAKESDMTLIYNLNSIHVKCLPDDFVENFEIDISNLKNVADSISVGDVNIPQELELLSSVDDTIVSVTEVQEEIEAGPADEGAAEGEEGAEGGKEESKEDEDKKEDKKEEKTK